MKFEIPDDLRKFMEDEMPEFLPERVQQEVAQNRFKDLPASSTLTEYEYVTTRLFSHGILVAQTMEAMLPSMTVYGIDFKSFKNIDVGFMPEDFRALGGHVSRFRRKGDSTPGYAMVLCIWERLPGLEEMIGRWNDCLSDYMKDFSPDGESPEVLPVVMYLGDKPFYGKKRRAS